MFGFLIDSIQPGSFLQSVSFRIGIEIFCSISLKAPSPRGFMIPDYDILVFVVCTLERLCGSVSVNKMWSINTFRERKNHLKFWSNQASVSSLIQLEVKRIWSAV